MLPLTISRVGVVSLVAQSRASLDGDHEFQRNVADAGGDCHFGFLRRQLGHPYGAALALKAARELGPKVQSLILAEPVSFKLLRSEHRPEWAEVERLGVAVLSAV